MTNDNKNLDQNFEKIKKATLEESKKIWQKTRGDLRDEIDRKTKKYKSKSYDFQMASLGNELVFPIDQTYGEAKRDIEMTPEQQTDKMTQRKEEMRKEIETGYSNAIALLDSMTREESMLTYDAAAKIMIYAPKLTEMAKSEKGKPLTEMFNQLLVVTTIGEKEEKVLTDALLDPETDDIALFALTMMRISAREDFTKKFIKNHPEKTVWLMEEGNKRGCYTAQQMKMFMELASKDYKDKDSSGNLTKFKENEKFYDDRYTAVQNGVVKRMQGLMKDDDGNPVLKAFTFEGVATGVGYLSSIMTIIANLAGNREKYMKDPSLMTKNLYLMGATGALLYLRSVAGEKKVSEHFTPKSEKERVERMKGLARMNEIISFSSRWGNFLEGGGAEFIGLYTAELKKDPAFIKRIPQVKDLLVFCKKNEEKKGTPENKRASVHLEELIKRSPDQAQKDMEKLIEAFDTLKVENQQDFVKATIEAKENLS